MLYCEAVVRLCRDTYAIDMGDRVASRRKFGENTNVSKSAQP